jgi:hypothetical protein
MNVLMNIGTALFELLLVAGLAVLGLRESASGGARRVPQRVRVRSERPR